MMCEHCVSLIPDVYGHREVICGCGSHYARWGSHSKDVTELVINTQSR